MDQVTVTQQEVTEQLLELGVMPGGILLVHCSFSAIGPVEHGPLGLITALQTVLGGNGTLVMPSMADTYDQPFDSHSTACLGMGIVAHIFWQLPGVLRSDNPHAFAAKGPAARAITAPHPVDFPHGLASPVGRVYAMGGQVLLLGVGHDANTTIHVAEALSGVRYRRQKQVVVVQNGQEVRVAYAEIDHCCANFALVEEWLDSKQLQQHGTVGNAEARLAHSPDIVRTVINHIQQNETVFLHPLGVDKECDEARASLLL